MSLWQSFSIPVLLNIGRTSSWLHYLPLASGFCSVLYLLVIAAKAKIARKFDSRERLSLTTKSVLRSLKRPLHTIKGISAIAANVRIRRYLKTLTVQTEVEEARILKQQLERHIPGYKARKDERGVARWIAALLSAVLVASWAGWALLGLQHLRDAREIAQLKEQVRRQERVPDDIETWHDLRVMTRIDDSSFSALTLNPRTKVWKLAYYTVCPQPDGKPLPLDADVQPGALIISVDWIVDRVHACKDMNSKFAGFNFWRKPDAKLILTDWQARP